ncbi:hypothetical protein AVEN_23799-1 [Araneus ventricosus]|uniref:Uncharacterized protein n=1 Tax=Araneus ventricosus TaxID=182803 RepID=A0A4Y2S420_ARAVE|nr:hypothetical protein AVEN_23799-1 [Araneus ventricosus]
MTRTIPELTHPLLFSVPHRREGGWPQHMIYPALAPYKADLQWNRDSNLQPSGPEAETLPLGHRCLAQSQRQMPDFSPILLDIQGMKQSPIPAADTFTQRGPKKRPQDRRRKRRKREWNKETEEDSMQFGRREKDFSYIRSS